MDGHSQECSDDAHERQRRPSSSPVDSPYTSARSPSGHLIPYSPAPAGRRSRDHIPWVTGSRTSFHDEPSTMDQAQSQALASSIVRANSGAVIRSQHGGYASHSDALTPSHPPSPSRMIGVGVGSGTPTENPGMSSYPYTIHFNANQLEPPRSRTPMSQLSSSQKSYNSRNSTGRLSYREHHGPPARLRTPVPDEEIAAYSLPALEKAEPADSAIPTTSVALPREDNPNQPGPPITVGHRFFPMSVSGVLRYDSRKIRHPSGTDYKIEAMLYWYPETPPTPREWTAYRHPEGALYFIHEESKTFTEVNICEEEIYEDIEYFRKFLLSELKKEIKKQSLSLRTDEVQLVLEPKLDEQGVMCCYYFVNPSTRSLFWLDGWEGYEIFHDCKGTLSLPHKGLAIQAHYWSHWDLYPNFCEVTQELKDEIVDMILHATCDHLTSNRSSCPLNPEELNKHLHLIDRIDPAKTTKRKHSAIIIGRIMHIFYNNYFLNFYGEDCARLNFDQTIHGWKYHPSLPMKIFAPLLFLAPVKNVRLLHRIFVDEIASKEKWNMFITKLNSQLQETSVLATVLLNANVAFLPKQSGTGTSPQQFLSYSSLVVSMASIILGLVFMGHIRTEARNTPFEAAKFLHGLRHEKHGLETLAVVYSLPHAFLMWGMFLFFAAFAVQWCYPTDATLRASAGALMLVVALVVAWCVWTARDRCEFWWFQSDPNQIGLEQIELEGETKDDEASCPGISALNFPTFGFKAPFNRQLKISVPEETRATQNTNNESYWHSPSSSI